jgi:hypothetical protein
MSLMNLSPATFFKTAFPVRVPNASGFVSRAYQDLIDESFAATDVQQLRMSLRELTQILLDEAFVLVIAENAGHETGPEVTRASVSDVTWDRVGGFAYQDVWLK